MSLCNPVQSRWGKKAPTQILAHASRWTRLSGGHPTQESCRGSAGTGVLGPRREHTSVPARSPPHVPGTARAALTRCQEWTQAPLLPPRSSCYCGEREITGGSAPALGPSPLTQPIFGNKHPPGARRGEGSFCR